jgi:excisionase family DNA binding protein
VQHIEHAYTQPLLITIKETMEMLRVSRSTMNKLINREGLPVHRFGRRILIDPEEIRPWLHQRRQAS